MPQQKPFRLSLLEKKPSCLPESNSAFRLRAAFCSPQHMPQPGAPGKKVCAFDRSRVDFAMAVSFCVVRAVFFGGFHTGITVGRCPALFGVPSASAPQVPQ